MNDIPWRMRDLDRAPRGYTIPFVVLRDTTGQAHFTVNDEAKRMQCFGRDLCGICGTALTRGRWFVGGPLSAFDPHGIYVDPPMHAECARFALQTCPYLAAPHYGRSIAGKSYTPEERAKMNTALVEYTMLPERPPLFVAIMAIRQTLHRNGLATYVAPARPYRFVEYWRHGQQVPEAQGRAEVAAAVMAHARQRASTGGTR